VVGGSGESALLVAAFLELQPPDSTKVLAGLFGPAPHPEPPHGVSDMQRGWYVVGVEPQGPKDVLRIHAYVVGPLESNISPRASPSHQGVSESAHLTLLVGVPTQRVKVPAIFGHLIAVRRGSRGGGFAWHRDQRAVAMAWLVDMSVRHQTHAQLELREIPTTEDREREDLV